MSRLKHGYTHLRVELAVTGRPYGGTTRIGIVKRQTIRKVRLEARDGGWWAAPTPRALGYGTPYVFVDFNVCHSRGCAATRLGKKSGPCDCGGDALMAKFVRSRRVRP